ncbi:peptidase M14 [Chryseobacterium sp. Leaf404]|uniref:M14 family zinc carboxypeptidase n=1 Tax=unclassified Chryseobacterium TaxID=2593645 RepID=UPI0006F847CF|nr:MULTISPECIES: M14 family zinc carboxypeptidase [unclassified Chryseobacterium]KQT17316.1 peptidase M14 [Chryseobacterium sp. Leaf404]
MNFEAIYKSNQHFKSRYIFPERLFHYLRENFAGQIFKIGISYLKQPIYKLSFGTGPVKIIAWSQMHGNESNATLAMIDLLFSLENDTEQKRNLESRIHLDFIFMLNPDGSKKWTRLNAQELDLNRDFHNNHSAELKFLKETIEKGGYHYGLNLHEQRTIFTTDGIHPATLSFLSPSEDQERNITENRKKCMAVISEIFAKLENLIPNQIGRYSDEFYPTSTGDNFMKAGLPTVLFEGGHFENDYLRKETRKYYTIALYYALEAMAELNSGIEGWEDYFKIPENKETHYDIIYRNVKLNTDHECILDIAVQYKEFYESGNDDITFVPYVVAVGDVKNKKGWKEFDCSGKRFVSETKFPKLDEPVRFSIE